MRLVYDIDILIDARALDIQSVRARLVEMDARFAIAGLKLYFVQVSPRLAPALERVASSAQWDMSLISYLIYRSLWKV